MLFVAGTMTAQNVKTHKVKRGETIYGIAHANGVTEAELRRANPGMESADYVLKKGSVIVIPEPGTTVASMAGPGDVRNRAIRMGVMLPLHNLTGDGKRMVEYYRGLLMACDSLKREGVSIDVYAWNTPDDADIQTTLEKPEAAQCDIIFGPLYSKQMEKLSTFCQQNGIMLVIPFSINAPQVATNSHIFQVYQHPDELTLSTSRRFAEWFRGYNIVIVNCEDPNSTKGDFTAALRRQLEAANQQYVLTSLASPDAAFASAFSMQKQNVVVLNSASVEKMKEAFVKLKGMTSVQPAIQVSVFGYQEWMEQAATQQANFHKYNMYIPAPFFTNLASPSLLLTARRYRGNFNHDMMASMPRFALTGFDHAMFFLRGLHLYGSSFDGAMGRLPGQPVQTPLKFERQGNGGYQNKAFMFIHYKPDHQIETINY